MTYPVYLINLDGSDDRLNSATRQLQAAGLDFERVPAFDGRGLSVDEFPDYNPDKTQDYMGRPLRGGEIGCYLSHLESARRFLSNGAKYGLVLEDDMKLADGFASGLVQIMDWLDAQAADWFLINIGANKHKIFTPLTDFTIGGVDYQLTRAHYFPMTTTGLIWSRPGAEAFVAAHDQIFCPVDHWFRYWLTRNDRGLATWPALVSTTEAESEITADSAPKRSATGRHKFYGLIKQRRLMVDKILALRHKWRRRAR